MPPGTLPEMAAWLVIGARRPDGPLENGNIELDAFGGDKDAKTPRVSPLMGGIHGLGNLGANLERLSHRDGPMTGTPSIYSITK